MAFQSWSDSDFTLYWGSPGTDQGRWRIYVGYEGLQVGERFFPKEEITSVEYNESPAGVRITCGSQQFELRQGGGWSLKLYNSLTFLTSGIV